MFDTIFNNASSALDLSLDVKSTLISIFAALVLGLIICFTYLAVTAKKDRSASFILSLIILPAIVAVVIVLIGGNLARAFSMAGIFTIVRFRSIPGDSKDISYVFLSMAVGLSVGLGYLTLGAVITVIVGAVIVVVIKTGFGITKQKEKRLKITIPEDMNYQDAFDDLFAKYTNRCEMLKVRTTNMGTLFELSYDVIMKNDISEKEFIDSLRCRNGNLTIQLGVKDTNSQQL
jgi:hypothetical protein